MSKPVTVTSLLTLAFLLGCELDPQNDYEEHYVVESYLVAQEQLPPVRISTTSPALEEYEFEDVAVPGAEVEVHLLEDDQESAPEEIFNYTESEEPGVYTAQANHRIQPARSYRLNITPPDDDSQIDAFTTVPDTFSITTNVPDTVVYQSSVEQLEITVTPSDYPGRQGIYVVNTVSLNPEEDNMTPYYRGQLDEDTEVEDFRDNSSGIINEESFRVNEDSTITLRYPWIGAAFYEDNLMIINTIDDNIFDFLRSQSVQLGGNTMSPGEIQNAIYHVEGGIGVFGSTANDTIETYIQKPPLP